MPLSHHNRSVALGLSAWSLLILAGCASRERPTTYPANSPASLQAPASELPQVTRALDGDPPLQPVAGDGWIGLSSPAPAAPHAGHGGAHHGGAHEPPV